MLTQDEMREMILRLTKERNDALIKAEDMERSANSAREIARVAMSHTSTECIRVEFSVTAHGLQLIVCCPQNEERDITQRIAKHLDPALREALGWTDALPKKIGATG